MPKATLPPDPEDMNNKRSGWVQESLNCYADLTGQGIEADGYQEIAQDFLANLGHFCDRHKLSMTNMLRVAAHHYDEETDNKGTQFSEIER